jgi:PAS domain S-box-containing protein
LNGFRRKIGDQMLNYEKLTKAKLIETLKSFQTAESMDKDEREQLLHELQVHQIELEMQNQELRETQQQLEETGNLYADLYDFAPVGYISFNDNGFIQEINLTGATLLGKERSRLINTPFAVYVTPKDLGKFRDHLFNCRQATEKVTTDIGLIVKENAVLQVQLSSVAAYDLKRKIILYRTAFTDITEQKRVDKALCETRNYLDNLIQHANAPIIVWDPQLKITRVNHAFEHLTGYYAAEVIGGELRLLFPASSRTDSLQKIAATLSGEHWDSVEIPILRQDSGVRVVLWNSANIYAEDSQTLLATIAQGQDITERIQVEDALRESEKRYSDLFHNNHEVMFLIDPDDGKIVEANPAACSFYGYDRQELTLKKITDFNTMPPAPNTVPAVLNKLSSAEDFPNMQQGQWKQQQSILFQHRLANGENRDVEVFSSQITVKGRSLLYLIIHDITERQQIEHALQKLYNELEIKVQKRTGELTKANYTLQKEIIERKQAEGDLAAESERLNVILCSIADGVIAVDTDQKIILMNKNAEKLTGWTREEADGRLFNEIFQSIYDKQDSSYEDLNITAFKAGTVSDYSRDIVSVSKDGSECMLTINGASLLDTQGNNIGTVMVFHDITKQRNLEDDLLKTQKLESLGILAGGIAHDFNNFLAAIMASAQLANIRLTKGIDIHQNLTDIEQVINKAAGLTKQLLTFSKGGAPIKKTALIADLIKDTVEFTLHGTKLKCDFIIADDLWLAKVDEGQMSQVINNLVLNAVQAMPNGGTIKIQVENIKLEAGHLVLLAAGNYVKISIADQGVGIPEEHLSKIFDPYFTTKQNGNGLGLASSYTIIKKHKGYIGVQSELGVGTTFEIYLPASKKKSLAKEPESELIMDGTGKILLMDDETSIREVTGEILSQIGYEVAVAADGAEAISLYSQAKESGLPYDVVITDLTIPGGMGGKDVIAKLLVIDPEVKVIVSSGYSNDPVMSDYRECGFNDLVTKPYKIEELHQKILKIIQSQHQRDVPKTPLKRP